tara:strand:- start:937 stop:1998 length:1062 start_codon:yes stop_codon:yes gene_type:complete
MNITVLTLIAIGAFVIIFITGAAFLLYRELRKLTSSKQDDVAFQFIKQDIDSMRKEMGEGMRFSSNMFQKQYGESAKLIEGITEKLTRLDETNKQVVNFTDQLQSLQDILKNPKQRGVLGEYYLETLLKNIFPAGAYQMQYGFKDGSIVDAVVFVKEKIIPIDSKFSLTNYNRLVEEKNLNEKEKIEKQFKADIKLRIDETAKYIKPEEGTMDFAIMFIPHEAIYSDLLETRIGALQSSSRDLVEYATREKHVMIVSPTNFLAYLQTILQGLRAMQIEESAKEIRVKVETLQKHLGTYDQFLTSLGKSLGTSINTYNKASKEFRKIDKDVFKITESSNEIEVLELERPGERED